MGKQPRADEISLRFRINTLKKNDFKYFVLAHNATAWTNTHFIRITVSLRNKACAIFANSLQSIKICNDQELIQSNPTSQTKRERNTHTH